MAAGKVWYLASLNSKTDTLAVEMAAAAATGTLTTGNFGTHTDIVLILDYDVPGKYEIIKCSVDGTAITSATRGQGGTSDVTHSAEAKVMISYTSLHDDTTLKAVDRQDISTNNAQTNLRTCSGWGFIQGSAARRITKNISFPITFTSAPIVLLAPAGYRSGSDPSAIGDLDGTIGDFVTTTSSITTTGFIVTLVTIDAGNFTGTDRYGFTWMAIGSKT